MTEWTNQQVYCGHKSTDKHTNTDTWKAVHAYNTATRNETDTPHFTLLFQQDSSELFSILNETVNTRIYFAAETETA